MKKFLVLFFTMLFLVGCGTRITKDDLTKNDWTIEAEKDEPPMIIHFTDKKISVRVDTDSIKSSASNEWEEFGEDYAKKIIDQMNFDVNYSLNGNKMTWKKDDDTSEYTIKKEKKNIVLTPTKKGKDKDELILKPYTKKKQNKKNTTKETSSTSSQSKATSSSSEAKQVSLNDFVGGWGIPNSDVLFFINSDKTITNSKAETLPISDIKFDTVSDGSIKMSYKLNSESKEIIKNTDGSVTAGGQVYRYLGNVTMEQFLEQKNAENTHATPESATQGATANEPQNAETQNQPSINDDSSSKRAEVSSYFNQQRTEIIAKKQAQISSWISNGEVDWNEEIINNAMNEFTQYLGTADEFVSYVNHNSIPEIKSLIDERFQHAYNTMIQK